MIANFCYRVTALLIRANPDGVHSQWWAFLPGLRIIKLKTCSFFFGDVFKYSHCWENNIMNLTYLFPLQ